MNSKNKNIRDLYRRIKEFKKEENGDLIADSHTFCTRKNYSQSLNIHRISDVKQTEIHIAEPLIPHPSRFEVEIATAKSKSYKSPGSDQILAE
jgi:hypothetical protein